MKTKTLLLLCFIAAFAVIPVNAQNKVDKQEITVNLGGYYLECTGDYLYGDLTGEYLFMSCSNRLSSTTN